MQKKTHQGNEPYWHLTEDDFFHDLPKDVKSAFFARSKRQHIPKRQFLFFEEDPGDVCFYLESGAVRIFRFTSIGKEPIMFIRKAGEMFGLAELMDSQSRKCNAQAIDKSVIYALSKKNFEALLETYPALSRKVISLLGMRIRYLGEMVENLMVGNVSTRLMRVLTYLSFKAIRSAPEKEGPVSVPVTLSQSEFAAMTGSCQQTISETLKELQSQGLIEQHNREILLLKPLKIIETLYG